MGSNSIPFRLAISLVCLPILLAAPDLTLGKTITVPGDFSTIQAAINNAVAGDIIRVQPSAASYNEIITLKADLTLEGVEAARTIINGGGGTEAVITAASNVRIQKLTIKGGAIGIDAVNVSNLAISNNIIVSNSMGIRCQNANLTISHNTLDQNSSQGISCTNSQTVSINNNLLTNNGTGISLALVTSATISNNGFHANGTNGQEGTNPVKSGDPLYVSPSQNDYHFRINSPYLGDPPNNDPSDDLGAYGGSGADQTPFRITGLNASGGTDTINLTWTPNLAYNINGYRIYHSQTQGVHQNPAQQGIGICTGSQCSFQITGLSSSVAAPQPPLLHPPAIGNQKLFLSWNPPSDSSTVTNYRVYWGTAPGIYNAPGSPVDVENLTAYSLTNLINDVPYHIVVTAIARPRYFVSVTAIDIAIPTNESRFFEDREVLLNTSAESTASNEVSEFPEVVAHFPDLPDQGGCFIATAAYGSPLHPHVRMLRAFRDRFLLTHLTGRAFVRLYYASSPPLAKFLQQHEQLKAPVRILLLPAIGFSTLFVQTTTTEKTILFFGMVIAIFLIRMRRAIPLERPRL